jgi:dTDP-4-amino-4,6-dideoxy-D-galactose acyltransferase
VANAILREFGGLLADRKATFGRSLADDQSCHDLNTPEQPDVIVSAYAGPSDSPALRDLALASGVYSRFAVDPHFSRERFEAMYRRWIEGSVDGELADAVLVAQLTDDSGSAERIAGMITLSESVGVASIGLVAVDATVRGRGIGSSLMRTAHRWMRSRGAREARVVTQLANTPACKLYERAGYSLIKLQHYYHFWL